jgi:hypothetical protein
MIVIALAYQGTSRRIDASMAAQIEIPEAARRSDSRTVQAHTRFSLYLGKSGRRHVLQTATRLS